MRKYSWIIPWLIAGFCVWFCCRGGEDKESKAAETQEETHYPIIKGKYSHYVGKCQHISDSSVIKRGYATSSDLIITPDLFHLFEGDTLRLSAHKNFHEAAIVFVEAETRDTIDFKIDTQKWWYYYIKISDHNVNYERLERVRLIYKLEGQERREFVLSKEEFADNYEHLVKYLKLKKLKKIL